ncbi:MAG TPA: DNA replication/repair protein RecF [Streptosporangiaceae bacterium]|nr:DNA replication/repair protein RecF [Streptosporangiaceae bacterium]
MHLTRLALTDFRSYAVADLTLGPGASTLLGANGEGKTNLVEAAAYVATLGSHRVSSDAPLVRRGAERAILRAAITSAERDSLVEIEINPARANRARVNRVPVSRPRQVLGILRTVLFAPEDLALVKGDPEQRRRYLDELLVSRAPRYAGVRADYERVVRQRTALLKSARARSGSRAFARAGQSPRAAQPRADQDVPEGMGLPGALGAWDEHLAVKGAELLAGRLELTAALRPLVAKAYAAVSGEDGTVGVAYRQRGGSAGSGGRPPGPPRDSAGPGGRPPEALRDSAGPDGRTVAVSEPAAGEPDVIPGREALADGLREALARSRPEELERGVCLVGPHRDDLELSIGELPARGYASHGESWSMALALRLSSYELLRAGGDDPVLLLDDVFAELDAGRRDRLASLVADAEQVLVTAAVPADVPAGLLGARFDVASGMVNRAG